MKAWLAVYVALSGCEMADTTLDVLTSLRLPSKETKQMVLHCQDQAPVGDCAVTAGAVRVTLMKREF